MRLRWLPEAWQDVERLYGFLIQQNPGAAADAIDVILGASERLLDAPEIGRPMNDGEGRRELFTIFGAGAYVLRYMIDSDVVVIIRVWHSREHR